MPRSLAPLAAVPLVVAALSQAPLKTLTRPAAEFSEPFTQINGVRELRDGRVIVSDVREKTVQLVDLKTGSAQKIGREGSGPGEYAMPMRLLALPGDTSLVYDPLNRRFLVIGPDGKPGAFLTLEEGESGRGMRVSIGARFTDSRGRLYSQGSNFSIGPDGQPTTADSAPILRYDRTTKKTDTLAFVKVPTAEVRMSGGANNRNVSVRMGGGNPYAATDDWAVTPDGRLAVVRTKDYRVDWYAPDGRRTSGPTIAYQPIKVTEDDKREFRERRAAGGSGMIVMTETRDGNRSSRSAGAPPANMQMPEPTDWPEVKPPFVGPAAFAAPNGQLWVLRTRPAKDKIPTFDVFDASGRVAGRVAIPAQTRLVGFGNGTVYLARSDEDDLQYLQRYRMP